MDTEAASGAGRPTAPLPRPLRVLVVGRQPLARAGLRGLLAERADVVIVGPVASLDEAIPLAATGADVALAAWDVADAEGLAALIDALAAQGVPLALVADVPSADTLADLLRAGVRGVLLPDATADEVAAALTAAAQGLLVLDPLLAPSVAHPAPAAVTPATGDPLTERERQVLELLALGLPNKTIARRLGISEHTAKFHVGSLMAKLGAGSRTEAVTRAARRGLLAL
jgi:DNA-binding NarL/FixJ family response regulator